VQHRKGDHQVVPLRLLQGKRKFGIYGWTPIRKRNIMQTSGHNKLAIVHDFLIQMGGAERVVAIMSEAFPEAPIYTSVVDYDNLFDEFKHVKIFSTWMQNIPYIQRYFKYYYLLYPIAFRLSTKISGEIVWVSSSGFSKWSKFKPKQNVFCYCHTPPRYFWQAKTYLKNEIANSYLRNIIYYTTIVLRYFDYFRAKEIDYFIANSNNVRKKIELFYGRNSKVIYPPVNINRFSIDKSKNDGYFLIVSRLVGYKNIDLAVRAFSQNGKRLIVVGKGPDGKRLRKIAANNVEFRGYISDFEITKLLQNCSALIFPGEEDFGITPVEAQACGKPVLALGKGGALETIENTKTGLFFDNSIQSLNDTIAKFEKTMWDPLVIRKNAERFDEHHFIIKMTDYIKERTGVTIG
jgi:glycosyltransferase involved in cell wall biosynthesis